MSEPILHQSRTGRLVDLLAPDFSALDIREDIAVPLSRLARFGGGTAAAPWSVAQHSVTGADALTAQSNLLPLSLLGTATASGGGGANIAQ